MVALLKLLLRSDALSYGLPMIRLRRCCSRLGVAVAAWACCLAFPAVAQVPVPLWKVQAFANGPESLFTISDSPAYPPTKQRMHLDANGNVYVAGSAHVGTPGFHDVYDLLIVKYDAGGNERWRALVDGDAQLSESAAGIVVDAFGNVLVAGTKNLNGGSRSMLLIKYSSAGQELWRATSAVFSEARGLAVDAAGSIYVVGARAGGGYVSAKFDPSGNQLWLTEHAGSVMDLPNGIATDISGNLVIAGNSNGSCLTLKYNSQGQELWRSIVTEPTGGRCDLLALAVDTAGNVMVAGQQGANSATDYLTIKYSASGVELWRATLDSQSGMFDVARAIALDADGNLHVTGSGRNSSSHEDYLTVKYNSAGVEQWRIASNSTGVLRDQAVGISVDSSRNVYVTGYGFDSGNTVLKALTIKYDSAGNELWRVPMSASGTERDSAISIAVDAAGHVHIGGTSSPDSQSRSHITLVKYSQSGPTVPDPPFITSINASGNQVVIHFTPPVSNGGSSILTYFADCGIGTAVAGNASPLTVTGLAPGGSYTCRVIAANAVGNSVPSNSVIAALYTKPDPPVAVTVTSGSGKVFIVFSPPEYSGGLPIIGYTANCGGGASAVSGLTSPLTVGGLINGQIYSCSVVATNAIGDSDPTAVIDATPSTSVALTLIGAESRKSHGLAGTFALPIDLSQGILQSVSVESRVTGAGHVLAFMFNDDIHTAGSASAVSSLGVPIPASVDGMNGNEIRVALTGVSDGTRVAVSLAGVNSGTAATISLGFLVGDANGSRGVNATDISGVKARAGQAIGASNFVFDLNVSGNINATDIAAVKARAGTALP